MVDEDLEPLITRCPNCATQFRVTENQLAAAAGRVRCGACLTVFEGTEHLILDEESTFSDGVEADAALDALLDELGTEEAAEAGSQVAEVAADPALAQDAPVIFGGFEDEAADALPETDAGHLELDAAAISAAPNTEGAAADEAQTPADPDDAPDEPAEPAVDGVAGVVADAVAEEAPSSTSDAAADLPDEADPAPASAEPEGPTEVAAAVPDAGAAPADGRGADDADYKAWIQPGTPQIDQMVDEVVASAAAVQAETPEPQAGEAPENAPATADGFHLSAVEKSLEEEGVRTAPISFAPAPRRWWVVGVAAVLSLVLLAQLFYLQLPQWSRDPGWRGFYESVCGVFGCELPEIRAVDALRTRNLIVRSHPDLASALVIDVVIVNQADFAQRFPSLQLRFTSVGGLLVASRVFEPAEYLTGELSTDDLMPVNTPVQVSLEISDPGPEAVNYTLSFR